MNAENVYEALRDKHKMQVLIALYVSASETRDFRQFLNLLLLAYE